jgi:hypothetical protein
VIGDAAVFWEGLCLQSLIMSKVLRGGVTHAPPDKADGSGVTYDAHMLELQELMQKRDTSSGIGRPSGTFHSSTGRASMQIPDR